ncbi:MAG TPA: dephospho-CoA kinase, partial [Methanoregula sp.]|nr:dephospho-CoA kinase [Methanoregula sp.]
HNRDERELGWGLGNALKVADIHIRNEGTLTEFSDEVRTLLVRLGKSP